MRFFWYGFLALFSLGMLCLIGGIAAIIIVISYSSKDLPDYSQLKNYEPPVVSRVYAGDGRLMSEFAQEKRVFVPIEEFPDLVKQAFIAAEDKNFYEHSGIDYIAIIRAVFTNIENIGTDRRPVGASTITQQVAKNFLLTNEVSFQRKIREAILAFRMERAMTKDHLLELYLNEIFLGRRSYGVPAAALTYFGKALDELEIHEAAYLAALPKAPNNYHPTRKTQAAIARRNWVLSRMEEDGYITDAQRELAEAKPLIPDTIPDYGKVDAPYFTEEVRRELIERYGEDVLYQGGLVIRTSLNPRLQAIAQKTLREGLVEYDRRHGYRGPITNWENQDNWQERLMELKRPASMLPSWQLGIVLGVTQEEATVGLDDGSRTSLKREYLGWAGGGDSVRSVLNKGDIIMVSDVTLENGDTVKGLRQIPKVNGAIVAMDPHTGRVLAMQGGWSFAESEFNRATQAQRQPGSAFKPFVYLAALESEFTPATLVLDAPLVIDQGPGLPKWRPSNYSNEFYGPTPIRVGVEKSKNLMTVRLAEYIGMERIARYAEKFGVMEDMELHLANSLGAGETTVMRMTTGYAQLVNGGKKIMPTLIDRVQDKRGKTIFAHDDRDCPNCGALIEWQGQDTPEIKDEREQLADPRQVYQIVSMLEGVVQRGTATRIRSLGRPLAGKTGTTNESRDAWFLGFSPDLAVGVYIGFDEPQSLGRKETGSSVAVPIFKAFMEEALKDVAPTPFRIPPGIKQIQINAETGTRSRPSDARVIWEAFIAGTEPTDKTYILDGNGISLMTSSPAAFGTYNPEDGSYTTTGQTPVGTGGIY